MQQFTFYFILIGLLFCQTSCSDDDMETGDNCPEPTETYASGLFVINEGNFQNGAGSISFIGENATESVNFIYQNANCEDILGNVVQSIAKINDRFFIVVNNSHKVIVTDDKMDKIGEITGLRFPRYILKIDDNTAYVTQWTDETKGSVAVVNLNNFEIEETIPTGTGPENLIEYQGKIYIANGGGLDETFGDSTVTLINPMTHEVEKTLQVGNNPRGFQVDKNENLWVNCFGFQNSFIPNDPLNKNGVLAKINTETVQEIVELNAIGVQYLQTNLSKDKFYLLYNGNPYGAVYTFNVDTETLSPNSFIDIAAYGLGVHPTTGHIFTADAKDFATTGEILEYDENGTLLNSFFTSIGPNGFLFLE